MAKKVRFKIRNKGVEEAATGPESRAAVLDMATRMKAHAIAISPEESGDYIRAFDLNPHIRRDWPRRRPNPRACCDVVNADPAAIAIEVGTARTNTAGEVVTTPAFRVLRRTLDYHGTVSNRIRE